SSTCRPCAAAWRPSPGRASATGRRTRAPTGRRSHRTRRRGPARGRSGGAIASSGPRLRSTATVSVGPRRRRCGEPTPTRWLDSRAMLQVTADDVEEALANVIDPELGLDFVELGLIYGVEIDNGHVHVTFTLTSPGCPIGPQVAEQIDEFVSELEGVNSV